MSNSEAGVSRWNRALRQRQPTNASTVHAQTSTELVRCCHRCALLLLVNLVEPLRFPALHRLIISNPSTSPQLQAQHTGLAGPFLSFSVELVAQGSPWSFFAGAFLSSFSTPPIQSVVILAAHCPQPFANLAAPASQIPAIVNSD